MDTTRHNPNLPDPSFGHEITDVDLTAVDRVGILSLVVVVVSMLAMWGLMRLLIGFETAKDRPAVPVAVQGDRQPPEPRLQLNEPVDLATFRATEDAVLQGYGWVDQQAGVVRIPVDRAMQLVLERGFPKRAASPAVPPPAEAPPRPPQR
jgi:hypothetical protein